jgi:putative hydrolase of the HAD superfamily
VCLDAGGVIVLPHRGLVCAALAGLGIACDPAAVARAHYQAVRQLDGAAGDYLTAFAHGLVAPPARLPEAVEALSELADRERSGKILWSEPTPQARQTIDGLRRAGIAVVIVTNSDGHATKNLRDAGICQTAAGPGAVVDDVIDSGLVGSAKPDPAIFEVALARVGADPTAAVHVGDTVSADVAGARAAGIVPIHLDPYRSCRATDHRHVRGLSGIWRHITPDRRAPRRTGRATLSCRTSRPTSSAPRQ